MVHRRMTRSVEEILAAITQFEPNEGNWMKLDELLAGLWEISEPAKGIEVMLQVLERFPEEGIGVLWSIVHGLESLPDYEDKLVESLQRQPSHLGLMMISRIANAGVSVIGNQSMADILESVLSNEKTTPTLREQAAAIRERMNNRL